MKISGIVCEYNPFHNGHLYHIQKTRENGATHIAAVMSGNFVQRGEPAAMDKFLRARCAIKGGVDLVIEIPSVYVLSSAELYARAAVYLLDSLGCVDEISFGSECADTELIRKGASATLEYSNNSRTAELMNGGLSYPEALCRVIGEECPELLPVFSNPNNILGVEYLKALSFFDSDIKPFTLMRKNASHDSCEIKDGFASASGIRRLINEQKPITGLLPEFSEKTVLGEDKASLENLERIIIYALRTADIEGLKQLPDVGQGLEYRIKEAGKKSTLEEVLAAVKTRRYPMARIKRILMCLITGITKSDQSILPPYGRILAMNKKGCEILALAGKNGKIPFCTSPAKLRERDENSRRFCEIESRAGDIYALACGSIKPAGLDFTAKIGVMENE